MIPYGAGECKSVLRGEKGRPGSGYRMRQEMEVCTAFSCYRDENVLS